MKVEIKDVEAFKPVEITLNTKGEADKMWHLLNFTPDFDSYNATLGKITRDDLARFHTKLWEEFNRVHCVQTDC